MVLPLGAWEQHGPHLPLDTDTVIVTSVVDAEVQSRSNDEKVIWRYGQAIAKFMGNSGFREKLSISEKDVLELDHLDEQYDPEQVLSFQLMHRSQLCSKLCQEDRVYFEKIHDPPYFIGDFNKARPTGEMDLAVTVMLRDLVWVDSEFFFAGPTYYWHDQYLSEIVIRKEGRRATLERLLYQQSVPGLDVVYGDVVSYHAGESPEVELLALSEVSRASNNARIAGPDRLIVREGMGVVFETPVLMAYKRPFLTRIYGFVIAFKDDTRDDADPRYPVHIKIRVHLSKENIPTWLLSESRLKGSDLLQTNLDSLFPRVTLLACSAYGSRVCFKALVFLDRVRSTSMTESLCVTCRFFAASKQMKRVLLSIPQTQTRTNVKTSRASRNVPVVDVVTRRRNSHLTVAEATAQSCPS